MLFCDSSKFDPNNYHSSVPLKKKKKFFILMQILTECMQLTVCIVIIHTFSSPHRSSLAMLSLYDPYPHPPLFVVVVVVVVVGGGGGGGVCLCVCVCVCVCV